MTKAQRQEHRISPPGSGSIEAVSGTVLAAEPPPTSPGSERRITKEKLEKVTSVVGEEEIGEAPWSGLKLSYAAVLNNSTFPARQRKEREEEVQVGRKQEKQEA